MWHLTQYSSIDGLASCFVICGQMLKDHGCWTGRVLFHRYESPAGQNCISRVKEFGSHPSHEALLTEIEDWIRHSLFERWTKGELWERETSQSPASV